MTVMPSPTSIIGKILQQAGVGDLTTRPGTDAWVITEGPLLDRAQPQVNMNLTGGYPALVDFQGEVMDFPIITILIVGAPGSYQGAFLKALDVHASMNRSTLWHEGHRTVISTDPPSPPQYVGLDPSTERHTFRVAVTLGIQRTEG